MEEGVRVALLKLVTEGSLPMAEMSDSWERNTGRNVGEKWKEKFLRESGGVCERVPQLTLQSLMLLTTWLYSLLKVCVRRRRH